MITKEIEITASHGLHLRVAAQIVKATQNSQAKITFIKDGKVADASSIMELLFLGAQENSTVQVIVDGQNEQKAIKDVSEILIDGAGI
jgi:phosphotransferase system HPr (HPr) family protein